MSDIEKSKEELLKELQELKKENESMQIQLEINAAQQTKANEAITGIHKQMEAMFELNQALIIIIEPNSGVILDSNIAASNFYGYSKEQFKCMRIQELCLLPSNEVEIEMHLAKSMLKNHHIFEQKISNGEIKTVEIYTTPTKARGSFVLFSIIHDITDLKRTSNELRESELKYRLLAENMKDLIWEIGTDFIFKYISPSCEQMTGFSTSEIIGRRLIDFVEPSFIETILKRNGQRIEEFRKTSKIESTIYEFKQICKNGSSIWIEAQSIPIFDEIGNLKGFQGVSRNIEERKKVEKKYRESEKRYRILIENATEGILVAQGLYLKYVNPIIIQITGYSESDLLTIPFIEFVHSDYKELMVNNYIKRMNDEPIESRYEIKILAKDQSIKWIEMTGVKIEWECQPAIMNYVKDITERKEAEDELLKLNSAIKNLREGIFITNKDGIITYINPEFTKMYGYTAEEVVGKVTPRILKSGLSPVEFIEYMWASLLNKQRVFGEYVNKTKDGRFINIEGSADPILNDDGDIIGFIGIHRDISERKRSEKMFQDIIDKNPMSIQILDMEGYTIQTNSAHLKLFGAFAPSDYSIFKDSQLLEQGFRELFERIKNGEVVSFPDSYFNANEVDTSFPDASVWIKAIGFTLNDPNGNPEKIVLIQENITERKQTEKTLQDIIDKNPMSIQIVDKEGFTLLGNPAYIKLFGSVPPPNFSIFEDLKRKSPELEKLILDAKSGKVAHFPDMYYNPHDVSPNFPDNPVWISALIFPLIGSSGKPERFVFMHENITERKLAEETLQNKERYQRALLDNFPFAVWLKDTESKFLAVNNKFAHVFGAKNSDELVGKSDYDIASQDLAEGYRKDDFEVMKTKEKKNTEEEIVEQGERKWFETYKAPVIDKNNKLLGTVGFTRDITDRKKADEALRESEKRFRNLLQDVNFISVQGYAPDGETTYWNKASEQLYGFSAEEAIGRNLLDLIIPPEMIEDVKQAIFYMANTGQPIPSGELKLMRKDRSFVDVYSTHTIIQIPGKPQELFCIDIDLTERKNAENALKESETKFRAMFENSRDAISVSKKGIRIFANSSLLQMFKYENHESIVGKSILESIAPSHHQQMLEKIRAVAEGRETPSFYETRGIRTDGTEFDIEISGSNYFLNDEEYSVGMIRDITERKLAENALKESSKENKMLAAALRNINECITITDENNILIFVNDTFVKVYGYSREELIGQNVEIVRPNINSKEVSKNIISETINGSWQGELINRKKDGTEFSIFLSTAAIEQEDSNTKLLIGIIVDITERKKAEELLRLSQLHYQTLFTKASDGIMFMSTEGIIFEVNESFAQMHGYSPEEMVNMTIQNIDTPQSAKLIKEKLHRQFNGETLHFEVEHFHELGHSFPLEVSSSCITIGGKKFILSFNRDITERKKAEAYLIDINRKQADLLQALDNCGTYIFMKDVNGKYFYVNKLVREMHDKTLDEIIGQSDEDLFPSNLTLQMKQDDQIMFLNGQTIKKEVQIFHKNKNEFKTHWLVKLPLYFPDGKISGICGISTDVSELKNADEALRESEKRFRNLLQDVNFISVQGYAPDGETTYWNKASEQLYGFSAEEAIGRNLLDLIIPPVMIEDVKQGILYMASTGQPIPSGELKLMRKDSSLVDVYSTHTIIQIPGKPQELFCIDIDLTERKRAEEEILLLNRELENRVEERTTELQVTMERLQDTNIELQTLNDQVMNDSNRIMNLNEELMDSHNQLQEALATKDRFFAIIAHDLRNPFVALLNNTELLENYFDKLSNDEKTKLIGQIRNASKHTFLLLENLLLWAQSQKGSIKFMPVVIDLYDLVLKNKLIFQGQFTSKEIKIQIDIPVNAIVYADKEMINTILRNLISNAIKFTANGGLIEIGIVYSSEDIKSPSDYITESVKIYVKDSGIGMDSEIKSKLFKIDEKSSRKGTVGETGTGLGLILCKEFVEKHGGRIWVESEVGKGSTFWFSLPK